MNLNFNAMRFIFYIWLYYFAKGRTQPIYFLGGFFLCSSCIVVVVEETGKQEEYSVCWQWGHKVLPYEGNVWEQCRHFVWNCCWTWEILVETKCWLPRVPSHSNIADKPSGGDAHELVTAGYEDDSKLALLTVTQLFTFMKNKMGKRAERSVDIPIG